MLGDYRRAGRGLNLPENLPNSCEQLPEVLAAEQPLEFPEGNSSAGQVVAHATTLLQAARVLREAGYEELAAEIERVMEKA